MPAMTGQLCFEVVAILAPVPEEISYKVREAE